VIFSGPYQVREAFRAKFTILTSTTQESTSHVVELRDDEPAAIGNMLFYLYSKANMESLFNDFRENGHIVSELITIVAKILIVADKYHVIELAKGVSLK
jgi:hypothetical protein